MTMTFAVEKSSEVKYGTCKDCGMPCDTKKTLCSECRKKPVVNMNEMYFIEATMGY